MTTARVLGHAPPPSLLVLGPPPLGCPGLRPSCRPSFLTLSWGLGPRPSELRAPFTSPAGDCGFRPPPLGVPVCTPPALGSGPIPSYRMVPTSQVQVPRDAVEVPQDLKAFWGLTAQLMPLITALVKKAVESALASHLPAAARTGDASSRDPDPGEPRAKRHKGTGKDHKRKQPEDPGPDSGRGHGAASAAAKGKGARRANQPTAAPHPARAEDAEADGS